MLAHSIIFLPLSLTAILLSPQSGWAQPTQNETERTAELLATLLDAGRVVIERNQPLINDSRRGTRASHRMSLRSWFSMSSSASRRST